MKRLILAAAIGALMPSLALADRVVSLGGALTEIVYALGEEERLVGRDTTSNFPAEALDLPDVGYIRQLSAEGVLSVSPDLIITEPGAGPDETMALLNEASVPVVEMPAGYSADDVEARIIAVSEALGVLEKGKDLAATVRADMEEAGAMARAAGTKKRVLFVLTATADRIMAAGENSSAEAIIELAGGINAMEGFEGYKQVSSEAVITAQPDVILMMDRRGEHVISDEDLFAMPAFKLTPAARTAAVVRMDGMLLLGFGPRVGEATLALSKHLAQVGG
ncbi:MAG: heme/hemin ABC transporter substrate-binding protein [Maritimibacter sp.]